MLDDEISLSWGKVGVLHTVDTLHECTIASSGVGVSSLGGILHGRENTDWPDLFDKITNNLVIKILDRCPLNLLPGVLLLLCLESELNEDLLQLLIDVVNAQLFETVLFENLEAVNIQDTDCVGSWLSCLEGLVDALYDPVEKVAVDGHSQGISSSLRLGRVGG